jgi:hypothetical protein
MSDETKDPGDMNPDELCDAAMIFVNVECGLAEEIHRRLSEHESAEREARGANPDWREVDAQIARERERDRGRGER